MTQPARTADPSGTGGSASPDGTPARIALRRSLAMRVLTGAFILIATTAVYSCLAPRLGNGSALAPALAVLALLVSRAVARASAEAHALKIGPDGLSLYSRAGDVFARGRIVGCSQWSSGLLILAIASDGGRLRRLLIAADALPDDVFRQLAVHGRRGAYTL